jgi:nicotinamide riboside kinase
MRVAVVGRYLPPTTVDEAVLSFAVAMCGDPASLTAIVATRTCDPIDFEARRRLVAELVPTAGIIEASIDQGSGRVEKRGPPPDGLPRSLTREAATRLPGRADALVGPGLEHLALARHLGLDYVPVEVPPGTPPARAASPRSLADWHARPAEWRARLALPVVIMGPESTGKTTLARDLARHFDTAWVAEYLRVWLDAKGAVCEPADLPFVVAGHRASEAALSRHASRVLFCDTDPLMTAVYSRFYYGELPAWLDEAASARRAGMYLLLDCDVPWVADPQRDMPHRRAEILDLCRGELDRRGLPWTLIGGSWNQRFESACVVIERVLREARP